MFVIGCRSHDPPASQERLQPAERFQPVRFGDDTPYVLTAAGDSAVVVDATGAAVTRLTIPAGQQSDAHFIGSWLVWIAESRLRVRDLRTGKDATTALAAPITSTIDGKTSLALFDSKGVSIIDLASAAAVHRAEGMVQGRYDEGYYVLAGTTVQRFGEATKQLVWTTPIEFAPRAIAVTDVVTVRGEEHASILDRNDGKQVASGVIAKNVETLGVDLGRNGRRVFGRAGGGDHMKLIAHDLLGTIAWSVPWPAGYGSPRVVESKDGSLVALVETSKILVLEGATGKDRQQLAGTFVRFGDDCVVVLDDRSIACQVPGGAPRWSMPAGGGEHRAWPLGADVLLADSIPLHLSRIAGDGKALWSTELADAKLDDKGIACQGQHWTMRGALATIVSATSVQMIDLATGKRVELWHER